MIYVERTAARSLLAKHLEDAGRNFEIIDSINDISDSKNEIILKSKTEAYCRPCPATKIYRCCNYYTTDVMEGCPFDCSYCILQTYLGHKNIHVNADTASILSDINTLVRNGVKRRLGTGELSDSLALDHIFPFTKIITPLINAQDILQFEFKTKSVNIGNLLNLNPKNIIISWSLNPQNIVTEHESGSAPATERIKAARICAEAGYRLAFHFDPIIYIDGHTKAYTALIEELIGSVPETSVEYISVSTFRAPAALIEKMRERKNPPTLLQHDLVQGLDSKMRYFAPLRVQMLRTVTELFNRHWPNVFVYLCMEHSTVWEKLFGFDPGSREELETLFPYTGKVQGALNGK